MDYYYCLLKASRRNVYFIISLLYIITISCKQQSLGVQQNAPPINWDSLYNAIEIDSDSPLEEHDITDLNWLVKSEEYIKLMDQYLLKLQADFKSIKDSNTAIPLYWSVYFGCINETKLLLSSDNVKINKQYEGGSTLLHLAVEQEHKELVEILLEVPGIDVNIKNNHGRTPLHTAIMIENLAAVNTLLEISNINVNTQNNSRSTPLIQQL